MSEANITIPVDLTNPGQFFACCGLLELADRLPPKAEVLGSFKLLRFNRAVFRIYSTSSITAKSIVSALLACSREPKDPWRPICGSNGKPTDDADKTKPIMIGPPVNLRLGPWVDEIAGTQTDFKTWGANASSAQLFDAAAAEVNPATITEATLLSWDVGMKGRFGYDPRSAWDTLTTGYSPHSQGQKVATYPLTELLAAIGLQTFPPRAIENQYRFVPWENCLPVVAARAAANGAINLSNTLPYQFAVLSRGKFKNLSKAQLIKERP